ncbi:MAG: M56 family metallopeptidase [Verrucomicrobiota bacterium]
MNTEASFAPLLDLLLKSGALILLGTALLTMMQKASAANRHAVSVAIFVALLLLPFTKLMSARWSYSLDKPAVAAVNVRLPLVAVGRDSSAHTFAPPSENAARTAHSTPRVPIVIPWKAIAIVVWLIGATLLLTRRTLIALRLRAIVRDSFPIEDQRLCAKVRALLDSLGGHADVRESDRCPVPMAAGFLRPVVLLPVEARDWSDAFISSALRHEIGHIRRRDCTTRLLADVLCALYWVNPLVWLASRRMRLEQEQACDDLVLNSGARADEYAGHLVEVVRRLQGDQFSARHALAMAQPSTLETRVLAIMDKTCNRNAHSLRGAFMGITFAAAALVLCTAAQLQGADEKKAAEPTVDAQKPQMDIEAKFIEFSGKAEDLPQLLKSVAGLKVPGVGAVVPAKAADAAWEAMTKLKGVDMLASPRITMASKQTGKVEVAHEMRYPTAWDKDEGTGIWIPKRFDSKLVGVTFEVTAEVGTDRTIEIHMVPEITRFVGFIAIGEPDPNRPDNQRKQPVFSSRKFDAALTIGDEHTVLLGGIESEAYQKIKDTNLGTGDVQERKDRIKTQLLVFVTARISKPGGDTTSVTEPKPLEVLADKMSLDKKTGTVTVSGNVTVETPQVVISTAAAEIASKKPGDGLVTRLWKVPPSFFDTLPGGPGSGKANTKDALEANGIQFGKGATVAYDGKNLVLRNTQEQVELMSTLVEQSLNNQNAKWILPRVNFRDTTLREVVNFLVAQSRMLDAAAGGVNIVVKDAPAIEDLKINLDLTNTPFDEVLRYVAALANCELVREEFAFVLTPIHTGTALLNPKNGGAKVQDASTPGHP